MYLNQFLNSREILTSFRRLQRDVLLSRYTSLGNRIELKAKLTEVRLHDLRHSFASALINDGKSLYTVQHLLGHTNSKSTQRYAHLARETLSSATEAIGKLVGPALKEVTWGLNEDLTDLPLSVRDRS